MKIVWQKIYKSAQMIPYMYNPVSHILPSHWKRLIKPEVSLMKLKFISLLGNQVCSKISLRHALLRWQESYSCGKRGNNNKKEPLEHGFEPAPAMWSIPPPAISDHKSSTTARYLPCFNVPDTLRHPRKKLCLHWAPIKRPLR